MIEKAITIIKQDLEKVFDLSSISKIDCFDIHFGICRYIRNKFLWNNAELTNLLNKHFKTDNVDDLSHCILNHIVNNDR